MPVRLPEVSTKEQMTMLCTMPINAPTVQSLVSSNLLGALSTPLVSHLSNALATSVPITKHPLAMAAAPLVVGVGVWAAVVTGVALLFQEYRLNHQATVHQDNAEPSSDWSGSAEPVDDGPWPAGMDAQNNRRAFKSPALLAGAAAVSGKGPDPQQTP